MKTLDTKDALRSIPPVNEILLETSVEGLVSLHGRTFVLDEIRTTVESLRKSIAENMGFCEKMNFCAGKDIKEYILQNLLVKMDALKKRELKRVVNATGIVLHTNLGRAPLPRRAVDSVAAISEGYSNLEYDLEEGTRGSRHAHIESVIRQITGAEDGMIVNNNAAAVFLCLNTFANQKEVIISRGEQVEIGGSFRIPDIITRSGCRMVEVGTTNKTHLADYENAVTHDTAVLLKVHTSNYKVTGFTHEVDLGELTDLAQKNELMIIEDLGSGCLIDLTEIGLPHEKTVQESLRAGADLVTFSGDKLLGGPQAGIIVGKKMWIDQLKKNPLARMVRCDKTAIAALRAVLELYREPGQAMRDIPALSMLALSEEELQHRAVELKGSIDRELGNSFHTEITEEWEEPGGGSLPGTLLKGRAVALIPIKMSISELQNQLRNAKHPVISRISRDKLVFHVRTIRDDDIPLIIETLEELRGG